MAGTKPAAEHADNAETSRLSSLLHQADFRPGPLADVYIAVRYTGLQVG